MTNRRWLILFLVAPALLLSTAVLASVGIGEITYRFSGAPACDRLDPVAGSLFEDENIEPNTTVDITQGIFNDCENTITIHAELDEPSVSWIQIEDADVGTYVIFSGDDIWLEATVTFGNDTPAEFSAKDVVWNITRPE